MRASSSPLSDVVRDLRHAISGISANAMLMRAPMEPGRLPVSVGMRFAVGLAALATIVIGIFPEPFIQTVNWSLGIAQIPHVAAMMR